VLVDGGTDILMRGDEAGLGTPEAEAFVAAVDYAQQRTPTRPSIVNGSIAAAVRGDEGTETMFEVSARIEAFRHSVKTRPHRPIPH